MLQDPYARYRTPGLQPFQLPEPQDPMSGGGDPMLEQALPDFQGMPNAADANVQKELSSLWGTQPEEDLGAGKLVTKPTIARVGEKGPEAIIPLTPRAGNKLSPDLLRGFPSGIPHPRYRSFGGRIG